PVSGDPGGGRGPGGAGGDALRRRRRRAVLLRGAAGGRAPDGGRDREGGAARRGRGAARPPPGAGGEGRAAADRRRRGGGPRRAPGAGLAGGPAAALQRGDRAGRRGVRVHRSAEPGAAVARLRRRVRLAPPGPGAGGRPLLLRGRDGRRGERASRSRRRAGGLRLPRGAGGRRAGPRVATGAGLALHRAARGRSLAGPVLQSVAVPGLPGLPDAGPRLGGGGVVAGLRKVGASTAAFHDGNLRARGRGGVGAGPCRRDGRSGVGILRLPIAAISSWLVLLSACGGFDNRPFQEGGLTGRVLRADKDAGRVVLMGEDPKDTGLDDEGRFHFDSLDLGPQELLVVASDTEALRVPALVVGGRMTDLADLDPAPAAFIVVDLT